MRQIISLIAMVYFLTLTLYGQQKNVAVVDFQGLGISPVEAVSLTERFRYELFNANKFVVLERSIMDEILKEQGFQQSGCTSDQCLVEMGKLLNVKYIFGGSISQFGNMFTVIVRLIEIETGKIIQSQAVDLKISKEQLMSEGMKAVADYFAGKEMVKIEMKDERVGMDSKDEPELIYIKGGKFKMGDFSGEGEKNEQPVHNVEVGDYYIGKYEITISDYLKYCEETGAQEPKIKNLKNLELPIYNVSWYDALGYCLWLSKKTGKKYTLPTEIQWEYAARSRGKNTKYSGTSLNSRLSEYGWYNENSDKMVHPVGKLLPNELNIYDMSGNVAEWCLNDYYNYSEFGITPPINVKSNAKKAIRGGSYREDSKYIRTTSRTFDTWTTILEPTVYSEKLGFRIVMLLSNDVIQDTTNRTLSDTNIEYEKVFKIYDVTEKPGIIHKEDPIYPSFAQTSGIEGTVVVTVIIGKTGLVESAIIMISVPMLDAAALDAAKKCRFKPAKYKNETVRVEVNVPFNFKIK